MIQGFAWNTGQSGEHIVGMVECEDWLERKWKRLRSLKEYGTEVDEYTVFVQAQGAVRSEASGPVVVSSITKSQTDERSGKG